jgi:membrane associated rhomboid family serine protease
MERMLARLERRFGSWAIPNLTFFIVGGMAIVFLMTMARPNAHDLMVLDWDAVRHGQVWRLVTYLFLPRTQSLWWIIFSLMFVHYVGSSLESHWGSFRFNLFYLLACVGTTLAAFVTREPQTNTWINMSLTLAFGTLFPDERFYLYIVPVKAKWFAILIALGFGFFLVMGDWGERAAILAALSGYFIFCGPALRALLKDRNMAARQAARRIEVAAVEPAVSGQRVCAICGVSEAEGADIRVCSCDKCGNAPRTLCLVHARSH